MGEITPTHTFSRGERDDKKQPTNPFGNPTPLHSKSFPVSISKKVQMNISCFQVHLDSLISHLVLIYRICRASGMGSHCGIKYKPGSQIVDSELAWSSGEFECKVLDSYISSENWSFSSLSPPPVSLSLPLFHCLQEFSKVAYGKVDKMRF